MTEEEVERLRKMWRDSKAIRAELMRQAHIKADKATARHKALLQQGVRAARNGGRTKASIAREIGISRSTLDKIMEGSW